MFSQSILEEKPECDFIGPHKKSLYEIHINFKGELLVNYIDRNEIHTPYYLSGGRPSYLLDIENLEVDAREELLSNGAKNITFVIIYGEESIISASVLSKVKRAYLGLNIPENSWKICYISSKEYILVNPPPPPPPPPQQTTVVEIVDDEEEIEEEQEFEVEELAKEEDHRG